MIPFFKQIAPWCSDQSRSVTILVQVGFAPALRSPYVFISCDRDGERCLSARQSHWRRRAGVAPECTAPSGSRR